MPITLAVILGVVQGIAEFLPVSSSGHLVVFQHFLEPVFGAAKTPLSFDVLVHFATLLVTAAYLRKELVLVAVLFFSKKQEAEQARHLVFALVLGTLPAVIVVLLIKDAIEASFGSIAVAANGFIITTILLEFAHRKQLKQKPASIGDTPLDWELPKYWQALVIGCAQAVAIMPGVSRSGSTIAAALILGLPPRSAVQFSFYLLLPAVLGASILELGSLAELTSADATAYAAGFCVTALVGWGSLLLLVKLVHNTQLRAFAIYTFLLSMSLRFF